MNYVVLNGVDSRTIKGLLIQELPPIVKPAMRTEIEEIDGRDGDTAIALGYAAYDRTMTIGLYGNYDINRVIGFFNTSGTAIFSNESDMIYRYSITAQIDFERLARFRTASVTFHVQPFKFSAAEKPLTFTAVAVGGQGISVALSPTAAGETLDAITIYGKTIQSGTPTASAPLTITSVTGELLVIFSSGTRSQTKTVELGTVELGKIGTYQDYIFKNNGTWAKHTAISSFVVDTAEITIESYSNVVYAVIPKPSGALSSGNVKDIPCICTHAVYDTAPASWNTASAINKIYSQADNAAFWLGMAAGTTLEQAQAALEGCVINYVLLNRINAPLESQELINELDGLISVSLYDGSTVITTEATLQPVINVTAAVRKFSLVNYGNIYSRPKITIYGEGDINIYINSKRMFIIKLGDEGYITIDGETLEAYKGSALKNRLVTGNYDEFLLSTGENTITAGGLVTQMIVENYSRWL